MTESEGRATPTLGNMLYRMRYSFLFTGLTVSAQLLPLLAVGRSAGYPAPKRWLVETEAEVPFSPINWITTALQDTVRNGIPVALPFASFAGVCALALFREPKRSPSGTATPESKSEDEAPLLALISFVPNNNDHDSVSVNNEPSPSHLISQGGSGPLSNTTSASSTSRFSRPLPTPSHARTNASMPPLANSSLSSLNGASDPRRDLSLSTSRLSPFPQALMQDRSALVGTIGFALAGVAATYEVSGLCATAAKYGVRDIYLTQGSMLPPGNVPEVHFHVVDDVAQSTFGEVHDDPMQVTTVAVHKTRVDGATALHAFSHPKHAVYVFAKGAADTVSWAEVHVHLGPEQVYNSVAARANIVVYDRVTKARRSQSQ